MRIVCVSGFRLFSVINFICEEIFISDDKGFGVFQKIWSCLFMLQ